MIYYIFWVILSLFTMILTSKLIIQCIPSSLPKNTSQRYGALDGLRGILAALVYTYHYYLFVIWQDGNAWALPQNTVIQNLGNIPVKMFFMITAYLFAKKILIRKSKINWQNFYTLRLFRIMPLYLFSVALTVLISLFFTSTSPSNIFSQKAIISISKWALFIGDSLPWYSDAGKITAGVTWTLRYEWIFYLSLPLMLALKNRKLLFLAPILILFLFILKIKAPSISVENFTPFISVENFIPFIFGYWAAAITPNKYTSISSIFTMLTKIPYTVAIAFLLLIPSTHFFGITASIPTFVILLKAVNDFQKNTFLKHKSLTYLGEISYSIYLLHGTLLFIALKILNIRIESYIMPLISIILVIVSSITFKLIEKPFVNLGKTS